jgi:hypothetical protein
MQSVVASLLLAASPVLIPTLYNGPGAFGTRWSTAVVLNNHTTAEFRSPGVTFGVLCPIPEGCLSDVVPAGAFGGIASPNAANGLLLDLPDEQADIAFMARLAASPRNALTGGTELPVVREREFSRRALHFPYVPVLADPSPARTTLRIYGPDVQPGTAVRIELRYWLGPEGEPITSKIVELAIPPQPTAGTIYPAFAQVDIQDFAAGVLSVFDNISVVPLPLPSGELPRTWAFLTITDDVTQEVTVQRPQ